MTAATITESPNGSLAEDNTVITVTEAETYVTSLSSILGVQATWNEDLAGTDTSPAYISFSGRTITVHAAGVTDKKLFLTVKGRL